MGKMSSGAFAACMAAVVAAGCVVPEEWATIAEIDEPDTAGSMLVVEEVTVKRGHGDTRLLAQVVGNGSVTFHASGEEGVRYGQAFTLTDDETYASPPICAEPGPLFLHADPAGFRGSFSLELEALGTYAECPEPHVPLAQRITESWPARFAAATAGVWATIAAVVAAFNRGFIPMTAGLLARRRRRRTDGLCRRLIAIQSSEAALPPGEQAQRAEGILEEARRLLSRKRITLELFEEVEGRAAPIVALGPILGGEGTG